MHRLHYDNLAQICWKPTRISGPKWIRELARHLQQTGVLTGLGWNNHEPETNLIVLDSEEVLSNDRWKELHGASDRVHKTGKDPRGRNVVFSSIALLANAVWCENVGWEVCGIPDHCIIDRTEHSPVIKQWTRTKHSSIFNTNYSSNPQLQNIPEIFLTFLHPQHRLLIDEQFQNIQIVVVPKHFVRFKFMKNTQPLHKRQDQNTPL
ncbi:hypothetical protein IV203_034880 [Nitzschia inconspicua]|uniref:Uncharacterized protein n=1 Tax=Nitzschia inconspicua TaxID=303405 RepID=A0A9K3LD01_9STRA|nr:hypothetical protein IV203_034880 [Nitzschia inconspicua]